MNLNNHPQIISLLYSLDNELIKLLNSLSPEEWNAPTIAKKWKVKDIASHLLDTTLRGLSVSRDNFFGEKGEGIEDYQGLVAFLNKLNMDWTSATARLSPQLLISLLKYYGKEFIDHLCTLDPEAPAVFSVAWAGQETSPNWFHIAREYTERFLHQQQIRDAVGKQELMTREFFYPFIDIMIMALPYTYRNISAREGTTVSVIVTSEIGGRWNIIKRSTSWEFIDSVDQPDAMISMKPDTACKLFSKGITPDTAQSQVQISGNKELAITTLKMVSVMA
jgi:uncharacterized protein (TIGR03083 family)